MDQLTTKKTWFYASYKKDGKDDINVQFSNSYGDLKRAIRRFKKNYRLVRVWKETSTYETSGPPGRFNARADILIKRETKIIHTASDMARPANK